MPPYQPPPPLLLTQRLTSFLHTNLSPQIHTALLVTPSGKLLSYASATPVSTLRTQGTVAASLWALHAAARLPSPSDDEPRNPETPAAITLSLAGGSVAVIRRLACGLLFVCVGPDGEGKGKTKIPDGAVGSGGDVVGGGGDGTATSGTSPPAPVAAPPPPPPPQPPPPSLPLGSSPPSETASVGTSSTTVGSAHTATAMAVARRHVEELARWLDDKLGTLSVPEEGIGGIR